MKQINTYLYGLHCQEKTNCRSEYDQQNHVQPVSRYLSNLHWQDPPLQVIPCPQHWRRFLQRDQFQIHLNEIGNNSRDSLKLQNLIKIFGLVCIITQLLITSGFTCIPISFSSIGILKLFSIVQKKIYVNRRTKIIEANMYCNNQ